MQKIILRNIRLHYVTLHWRSCGSNGPNKLSWVPARKGVVGFSETQPVLLQMLTLLKAPMTEDAGRSCKSLLLLEITLRGRFVYE